jgi:hypothetical protein
MGVDCHASVGASAQRCGSWPCGHRAAARGAAQRPSRAGRH